MNLRARDVTYDLALPTNLVLHVRTAVFPWTAVPFRLCRLDNFQLELELAARENAEEVLVRSGSHAPKSGVSIFPVLDQEVSILSDSQVDCRLLGQLVDLDSENELIVHGRRLNHSRLLSQSNNHLHSSRASVRLSKSTAYCGLPLAS